MNTLEAVVKAFKDITYAEWIMFKWIEVTTYADTSQRFMRTGARPLDEAMNFAGGTIKDLEKYVWALDPDSIGYKTND